MVRRIIFGLFIRQDLYTLKIFFNVYLLLREKEHEQGRGREADAQLEAASKLHAVSTEPDVRLELADGKITT